jgi:hypothetical protein
VLAAGVGAGVGAGCGATLFDWSGGFGARWQIDAVAAWTAVLGQTGSETGPGALRIPHTPRPAARTSAVPMVRL